MIDIIYSDKTALSSILERKQEQQPDVTPVVSGIISDVKQRGDTALREYTLRFDKADLESFLVTDDEIAKAVQQVDKEYISLLNRAAENIRNFHKKQVRTGFINTDMQGVISGQRIIPLERVGVYVPGGTAAYPSTVLMDVIPAQIAGVQEIVMITPPEKDGSINPVILAAAKVAGVTKIFKAGGAQGIAALAYGTQTIPKVDKIVGPGNIYVATAKRMVYGVVDIDMIAGPSDILIIADSTAQPQAVAADMLGQAEHDTNAAAVLVTTDEELAKKVQTQLQLQLEKLSRKKIAEESILNNGRIIVTADIEKAVEIANAFAPEHLEICTEDPFSLLHSVKNAGSVFLGNSTPEALGDYYAGPNHTLPTEGTSRFYSPLGVDDFVKRSSYLYYSAQALADAAEDVVTFALSEGLDAHANSVKIRMQKN